MVSSYSSEGSSSKFISTVTPGLPAGMTTVMLYGYNVTLKATMEPTGTGLDQSMFFTFETARDKPVFMVESGPAAGVVAVALLSAGCATRSTYNAARWAEPTPFSGSPDQISCTISVPARARRCA